MRDIGTFPILGFTFNRVEKKIEIVVECFSNKKKGGQEGSVFFILKEIAKDISNGKREIWRW